MEKSEAEAKHLAVSRPLPGAPEVGTKPYRFPLGYAVRFLWSFFLGRRREMAQDARLLFAGRPTLIENADCIPDQGPFIIVANHYQRPGLLVLWPAFLISQVAAARQRGFCRVRWVMTNEWTHLELFGLKIPARRFFRRAFAGVSRVYGTILLPVAPGLTAARAAALRTVLEALRAGEPVGLFPEGAFAPRRDVLTEAKPGSGLLLLRLSSRGIPILPAGIYESGGGLVVICGPPFSLRPLPGSREEQDHQARQDVMTAIGRLLPPAMWGFYRESLAR
ncbi:MAG TPA: 1-acyl-sn-glycerol-3-phosphate acyltransferase [Dehalococcoidia bacterium]|nr:1-acyl-sn-glycerol-3-phosphate acyltransferase [Dehalococcoidia bacterium]